jgi:hypothetical protein
MVLYKIMRLWEWIFLPDQPNLLLKEMNVPQTPAEQIAKKMESEAKRLAPQAVIRIDYSNYKDDGADIYVYAPRKVADMLRGRLKSALELELRRIKGVKARLLMEDIENMTVEAKKKYGIQVA